MLVMIKAILTSHCVVFMAAFGIACQLAGIDFVAAQSGAIRRSTAGEGTQPAKVGFGHLGSLVPGPTSTTTTGSICSSRSSGDR